MKLKAKLIGWSAGRNVAILHLRTAEKLGLHIDDRIIIKKSGRETIAALDLAKGFLKKDEIVVSTEVINELNIRKGNKLEITTATKPESVRFINKKLECKKLSKQEIFSIIKAIVNNALTEAEVAYFVSAVYNCGMSLNETISLIDAMVETGKKLNLNSKNIVDKHSIGGIPGNRTTPIVVSICASAGLLFPKNSSRAITSAAGTADVIETIARVDFTPAEIKKIVKKTNACMVWGGALGISPSDDMIIRVERSLNLDPESQLIASIMSKKIAVGSKYILIDVPYGKSAKVDKKRAVELKNKFKKVAKHYKIRLDVVLTDGKQPIGNGIGPLLEIRDVISVLKGKAPIDLREKSLLLCSKIFQLTRKSKSQKKGYELARKILDSGQAYKKFKQIIKAQKGDIKIATKMKLSKHKENIFSKRNTEIISIDNKKINYLARACGCPVEKDSGLYLWKQVGDKVDKGEKLITFYAGSKEELKDAIKKYKKIKPIILK